MTTMKEETVCDKLQIPINVSTEESDSQKTQDILLQIICLQTIKRNKACIGVFIAMTLMVMILHTGTILTVKTMTPIQGNIQFPPPPKKKVYVFSRV